MSQRKWMLIPALGLALTFTACSNEESQGVGAENNEHTRTEMDADMTNETNKDLNDADVIPSETGDKKETTNRDGKTHSGMGKSLYGSIGSSGIYEGGISSYFESILKGEGISGVHVFVIDDTVVLARAKPETTSHQYDSMQKDVLNGNEGKSGKGELEGNKQRSNRNDGDNLKQARKKMNEMFSGNVKILTVTDQKTMQLTKNIKKEIKNGAYQKAADDVLKLLKMTK